MTGLPPYLKVWTRHWGVSCYSLQTLMFLRAFITYCPVLWYSIFLLGLTVDDSGSCKYWLASGSNESTIHVHDLSSLLGTMCVCVCVFTWWRHRLSVCATSCHLIECSETHQKYANAIDYSFSRRLAQRPVNDLIALGFKHLVVRYSFLEVKLREMQFTQIDTFRTCIWPSFRSSHKNIKFPVYVIDF